MNEKNNFNGRRPRSTREGLFALVSDSETESSNFYDITSYIGQPMPYSKYDATCAVRVNSNLIGFSLLRLTKKALKERAASEAPLQFPRNPLEWLERKSRKADLENTLEDNDILISMQTNFEFRSKDEPAHPTEDFIYSFEREGSGNGSLELKVGQEDTYVTVGRSQIKISIFFKSPDTGRIVGYVYFGFLVKPDSKTTVRHLASKALFTIAGMNDFRIIAGVEGINIAQFNRYEGASTTPAAVENPSVDLPLTIYTEANELAGSGTVRVTVDLSNAAGADSNLLFSVVPSENIAEGFNDYYLESTKRAINDAFSKYFSVEEMKNIRFDIVLGEVQEGTVERVVESLNNVSTIFVTTRQYDVKYNA